MKNVFIALIAILLASCATEPSQNSMEFILDGVHHTPMEPKTISKYNDPDYLADVGYNGTTPHWHIQCALTYDSFEEGIIPEGSDDRAWILAKQEQIRAELRRAEQAGINVYPCIDICVLPRVIADKYRADITRDGDQSSGGALHGTLSPDINKPMMQRLIKAQIREIFETFPEVDGIVTRVGETYLFDTPYHSGGNPVGGSKVARESRIKGHKVLLNLLRKEVCVDADRMLFYRTWDFSFLHTTPSVYDDVMSGVEPHDNLCISIKYSGGDFHRLTKFNPTLGRGDHGYIVEIQCQPEYYGKGSHPVYIFDGVLNGFTEYKYNMSSEPYKSLNDLKRDSKFRGVWTWSRGGGWRGPEITNELWCDVNALSVATWARDTTCNEREVLRKSLTLRGVEVDSVDPFIELLHKADEGVLKGQCTLIDFTHYYFKVLWARDQFISGESALTPFFNYIVNSDKGDEMMREKSEAVVLWREIEQLSQQIKMKSSEDEHFLRTSSSYGRIKYELFEQIFKIFYYGKLFELKGDKRVDEMHNAIATYDAKWVEWRELVDNNADSATIYEPNAFKLGSIEEGVSGNKQQGVAATVDKYRKW